MQWRSTDVNVNDDADSDTKDDDSADEVAGASDDDE